ncbi:hypothetical protein FKM82_028301, partial [Ascaphus truei]
SAAIAFTLALFSHLVNHVNIRLQAELEENPVPAFQSDGPDDPESKEPSEVIEKAPEPDADVNQISKQLTPKSSGKKSHKYSRLSRLRRRRHTRKVDESDLSEGFDSDSSHGSPKGSENSESASEKSDEEAAFDLETDSDMNSQESRSDLEDMEDEPGDEARGKGSKGPKGPLKNSLEEPEPKTANATKTEPQDPAVNGPAPGTSEASIASNLQAMSTQMFQTKRCFRLAPTFTNVLVKPAAERAAPSVAEPGPLVNGDVEKSSALEQ